MAVDDKIKDEKLQYEHYHPELSALLPGEIDKYEYLAVEEILTSDQKRVFYTSLDILHYEKLLKNIQKQLKIKIKIK